MRTRGGPFARSSEILGGSLAVLADTTALGFGLVGSVAGASSTPPPGPYLAQAERYSSEIAARIGHPLSLSLGVVVNATDVKVGGKNVLAYADAENGSGPGDTGIATRCVIHINPANYNQKNTADFDEMLAHEVFHCYEAMDYPSLVAFGHAPNWLAGGAAEWVGETLAPSTDGFGTPT